jgi:cation diffusion facilitator CzcD-associated flavoprotein CzcO
VGRAELPLDAGERRRTLARGRRGGPRDGQLDRPARPRIEGAESFAGRSFHSAEWDHDYELAGKRVAVVGTGASAVQFVPEIAPLVQRLSVFQRTGNWFLPRRNRRYPAAVRAAIEMIPGLQEARRRFVFEYGESLTMAIRHPRTVGRLAAARSAAFMRAQLKDPEVRRKAWPDYTFGCKRVIFSSYFLPALQRVNVDLVTDAIARIEPDALVTADGARHEVDCIIWATGFRTNDFMFPMEITGAGGVSLHESWAQGAHAHLGISVPGFPNMFVLYGPNTNTSGGSIIVYLEAQCAYVRQALSELRDRGAGAIEVRAEVEAASDRALQARFAGTAWTECDSWYRDEHGRIVANWPGYMREYLQQTAMLDAGQCTFLPLPDRAQLARA